MSARNIVEVFQTKKIATINLDMELSDRTPEEAAIKAIVETDEAGTFKFSVAPSPYLTLHYKLAVKREER